MSDTAEQFDYWSHETAVSIGRLEVLKVVAKPAKETGEANVGQLFTATAHMTTQNGEDITVSVTGFLRGRMNIDMPRAWTVEDCYAPRHHQNGVPPVRLLEYPRNLRTEDGERLITITLSKLITDQLAADNGWREQIVAKVDAVTRAVMYDALGLEMPSPEPEQAEAMEESIDLDSFELDDADQNIDQLDPEPATIESPETDQIDLDAEPASEEETVDLSDEDDDDLAGLVDEWDKEDSEDDDLSALGNDDSAFDQLNELDDRTDIAEHNPEQAAAEDRADQVAEKLDWSTSESLTPSPAEEAPVLTEEADAEQAELTEFGLEPENHVNEGPAEPVEQAVAGRAPVERPDYQNIHQFGRGNQRVVTDFRSSKGQAMSDNGNNQPEKKIAREHVLFNAESYDIGFMGFEHGSSSVKDDSGEVGNLYSTRKGLLVVHVDETKVVTLQREEKEKLFGMLGFDRDAKKAYESADISCIKWLE